MNPTQAEALTMVCSRVFGNHSTITIAGSNGHFQLNAFKPVIAASLLQSIRLLGDAALSFSEHCVEGLHANKARLDHYLSHSLMLVTALNPHIGYDNAAKIAKKAYADNISLKEAGVALGLLSPEQFDQWVNPADMLSPEPDHLV